MKLVGECFGPITASPEMIRQLADMVRNPKPLASTDPVTELPRDYPCGCGWQEPYGFVPEADCPEHDTAEFVARMNAQFGAASARVIIEPSEDER